MSDNLFDIAQQHFTDSAVEYMGLEEYLELCKTTPLAYATSSERVLAAIGEPVRLDTSADPRLSRIFLNRTVKVYPAFADFFGMEEAIERVVSFFRHAAQGLEERKQILYLLGPVGGGKSSISERVKELMEVNSIYVLCFGDETSPVFETPLGLFPASKYGTLMQDRYGIDSRYLNTILSPWAVKRLKEANGDIRQFRVAKMRPSRLEQVGIAKTEPGDDNNQDISCLVGKTDIRKLEHFSQNDPDSYAFSGALCRGNQGILEFIEMFKAPIKVLHPLLTATQEGNYVGTEAISAIPFNGTILAHSNESEWQTFRNNKNNEAFLDRICVVKVPYCLRTTEEQEIYQKMISSSDLKKAPMAPETLRLLARFSILSRLKDHPNSNAWSKMRVLNGENIKESDPKAKSVQEYRDDAGMDEGMSGISTRFAFKILSQAFNYDGDEVSADPVHVMMVLEQAIRREQFPKDTETKYLNFIKDYLIPEYAEFVGNEIQTAYLEAYDEFGQSSFERYIDYADSWISDSDWKDPDTGNLMNRELLNNELEKIEKPAGIANPKDFRHEVVSFVMRRQAKEHTTVDWKSYEKLKKVIEKKMFASVEDLLPVISFGTKQDKETSQKHEDFVSRMVLNGYTPRQVRRITDWYQRQRRAG